VHSVVGSFAHLVVVGMPILITARVVQPHF
jgi:hypothetical protein